MGTVLCLLNAVTAYFISVCFRRQISSLAIPCTLNEWIPAQKAQACFHAAVFYFLLAVLLWLIGIWKSYGTDDNENSGATSFSPYSSSFLDMGSTFEWKQSAKKNLHSKADAELSQHLLPSERSSSVALQSSGEGGWVKICSTNTASNNSSGRIANYGSVKKRAGG